MPTVHDWTGGFRVFRKKYYELLKQSVSQYSGYVFLIAFLHKSILLGAKVAEVPIHFTDRRFGRSKIVPSEYIRKVFAYVIMSRVSQLMSHNFPKFLVVGTIGFIINTLVLECLVALHFHPAIGSLLGAELAIISNYILNNSWTFRDRKIEQNKKLIKFFQFNLTSLGAIILQAFSVYFGTHAFGIGLYRVFYVLGVLFGLVWNYIMYSRVIWKR